MGYADKSIVNLSAVSKQLDTTRAKTLRRKFPQFKLEASDEEYQSPNRIPFHKFHALIRAVPEPCWSPGAVQQHPACLPGQRNRRPSGVLTPTVKHVKPPVESLHSLSKVVEMLYLDGRTIGHVKFSPRARWSNVVLEIRVCKSTNAMDASQPNPALHRSAPPRAQTATKSLAMRLDARSFNYGP